MLSVRACSVTFFGMVSVCGSGSSLVSNGRKFTDSALDVSALCKLEAVFVPWNGCSVLRDTPSDECAANRNDFFKGQKGLMVCVNLTERSFAMLTKHAADGRNILPSFLVVSCVMASLRGRLAVLWKKKDDPATCSNSRGIVIGDHCVNFGLLFWRAMCLAELTATDRKNNAAACAVAEPHEHLT